MGDVLFRRHQRRLHSTDSVHGPFALRHDAVDEGGGRFGRRGHVSRHACDACPLGAGQRKKHHEQHRVRWYVTWDSGKFEWANDSGKKALTWIKFDPSLNHGRRYSNTNQN